MLVAEDVHFLGVPAEALRAANARLLPLVAHDRAGSAGRPGERWHRRPPHQSVGASPWSALGVVDVAAVGRAQFGAALGVHLAIGYLELTHVAPAILGAALFSLGLALSYGYLCAATNDSAIVAGSDQRACIAAESTSTARSECVSVTSGPYAPDSSVFGRPVATNLPRVS